MVRLVFRPFTQLRRSICTSESLRSSIRVSPDFEFSPCFPGAQRTMRIKQNVYSNLYSQAVTHPSTNRSPYMLDSLVRVSRRVGWKIKVLRSLLRTGEAWWKIKVLQSLLSTGKHGETFDRPPATFGRVRFWTISSFLFQNPIFRSKFSPFSVFYSKIFIIKMNWISICL